MSQSNRSSMEGQASVHLDSVAVMAAADPNVVSVSTIFSPANREGGIPDTILRSTDGVLFYVNIRAIRNRIPTAFATAVPLVPNPDGHSTESSSASGVITATTSCNSITLTIVLQALYGLSSASIAPSVDAIDLALESMLPNGIDPKVVLVPTSSIYAILLAQIPMEPMKVYAIAAQHDLEDLACRASSHLLGYDLRNMDDNLAQKMGPIYLKRLYGLLEERMKELNRIVIQPPNLHPSTETCSTERQRGLMTEWGLCIAKVLQEAKPSISPFALSRSFEYGIMNVECEECQKAWSDRTEEISRRWAAVKHTI